MAATLENVKPSANSTFFARPPMEQLITVVQTALHVRGMEVATLTEAEYEQIHHLMEALDAAVINICEVLASVDALTKVERDCLVSNERSNA